MITKLAVKNSVRYSSEVLMSGIKTLVRPPSPGVLDNDDPGLLLSTAEIMRLPDGFGGVDGIVDMNNTPTFDQGEDPYCADYGTLGPLETMAIIKYKEYISFDRELYAQKLVDAGVMTDKGAYIHKVMEWFHENGIEDQQGRKYRVGKPEPISKANIPLVMSKGFPVVTGGFWGWRYHDSNYVWLPKTPRTGGGHCTFLNMVYSPGTLEFPDGTKNKETCYANETSWGAYFGRHKLNTVVATGQLYLKESDLGKIFTPYIFTSIERIK